MLTAGSAEHFATSPLTGDIANMLYSSKGLPDRKPLFFVGSSQRDLQGMPEDAAERHYAERFGG